MVNYWDTSAIVPLLVEENSTSVREAEFGSGSPVVTCWSTALEVRSALERLRREGVLPESSLRAAENRFAVLRRQWLVVRPGDFCRERAERLLRIHPLRAADALQLASALVACGENTKDAEFHCGDVPLCTAARLEDFSVFEPGG